MPDKKALNAYTRMSKSLVDYSISNSNYQVYSLMRLFEEYTKLYTNHQVKLTKDNLVTIKRFNALSKVILDKDPRIYFNALFNCYSLYIKYKSNRAPDLEKLLDDKVLNQWAYLISVKDNDYQLLHINGSDSVIINALGELYRGPHRDTLDLGKVIVRYLNKDTSVSMLGAFNEGSILADKYPDIKRTVINNWLFDLSNLSDYQIYLKGFNLKALKPSIRKEIVSIGRFLGTFNNYQLLKDKNILVDESGRILWKKD